MSDTPAPGQDQVNILMVDDQPDGLLALEASLEGLGQRLIKARSGREALRYLLDTEFAVVLLDVQMPGLDGIDTAALIRERPATQHTPIIFLTAYQRTDVQLLRGYNVGAVDYLFKPLDPEILRAKVAVFVELARQNALVKKQAAELYEKEIEARKVADARAKLLEDLEQKHRELEAANRELESFSYSASHDLRSPLRRIAGYCHVLAESHADQLDATGKSYLKRVCDVTEHMEQIIDGLLALADVTRSELSFESIDLSTIANDIAAQMQGQRGQADRQVQFKIKNGLTVNGDARLMRVVLENLMDNAWKFTSKCSNACIEVGRADSANRRAIFVRDNGAGFDMAYNTKLFRMFQRLHSKNEFEGHGIGLATVQRIIHRHGGEIWAESKVDAGATFFFTLRANGDKQH